MKNILTIVLLLLLATACLAGERPEFEPIHPVNTYSIVAYDTVTGEFGAAVQSHWFKVADVIWLEPGVGAIATQSLADFSYGYLGLEMLKVGKSPQEALEGLLKSDPHSDVRQVAIIDKNTVAVHTGANCIAEAGDHAGVHYSVQANLMRNNTVWDAMAKAYETAEGDLADRMMAALEAAQAEGGDIRGKQSAAMVVVRAEPTGKPWNDRIVDIRVDDSPEPLQELRRLLEITRAYNFMNQGDEYLAAGDQAAAQTAYENAFKLAPDNLEIKYWYAVTLVTIGEVDKALPVFKEIFEVDDSWRTLIPRLVKADQLPNDPKVIDKIMAQ